MVTPDVRHPSWCEPKQCQLGAPGVVDRYHRSAAVRVDALRAGEPDISLQIWSKVDEPIEDADAVLMLTFDLSFLIPDVRAYGLDAHQVRSLLIALQPIAAILDPYGER